MRYQRLTLAGGEADSVLRSKFDEQTIVRPSYSAWKAGRLTNEAMKATLFALAWPAIRLCPLLLRRQRPRVGHELGEVGTPRSLPGKVRRQAAGCLELNRQEITPRKHYSRFSPMQSWSEPQPIISSLQKLKPPSSGRDQGNRDSAAARSIRAYPMD